MGKLTSTNSRHNGKAEEYFWQAMNGEMFIFVSQVQGIRYKDIQ